MDKEIIIIILGMSLVTHLPRIIPLVVLSKLNLPQILLTWLKYIPVAVLSALLVPTVLMPSGELSIAIDNKSLIASIPCLIVAIKTKNLFYTVLAGIFGMFILQLLF